MMLHLQDRTVAGSQQSSARNLTFARHTCFVALKSQLTILYPLWRTEGVSKDGAYRLDHARVTYIGKFRQHHSCQKDWREIQGEQR